MEGAFKNYMNGDGVPADVLQHLNINMPPLHINEAVSGVGRREVEQLLNLIPATKVMIEIDATWDGEQETLAGLMAGKYIRELHIYGCSHEIGTLPSSIEEVSIRASADCTAIRALAAMENIREITLTNGRMDALTWETIVGRSTKLRKLELNGTTLDVVRNGSNGLAKIRNFITRDVTMNDKVLSHEQVLAKLYEKFITYT